MKKFCLRLLISGAILSVTGFVVLAVLLVNGYDLDAELSMPVRSYAESSYFVDSVEQAIEVSEGGAEYTTYIMQEASFSDYGYDSGIELDADPDDINNIDIDISMGQFTIAPANSFAIFANNIELDALKYSIDGDRLSVSFNPDFKLFDFNFWDDSAEIFLYVPQKVYETISIDIDAGNAYISGMTANNLEFDMSAGEAYVSDTSVYNNSDIKMSAGYSDFTRCTLLNSSSIKVSAGDMEFDSCSVTGDSDIKVSAGALNMFLLDDFSHYSISAEKSAGELYIDGEPTAKEYNAYSALSDPIGTMKIKVSAGSCYIYFEED